MHRLREKLIRAMPFPVGVAVELCWVFLFQATTVRLFGRRSFSASRDFARRCRGFLLLDSVGREKGYLRGKRAAEAG
ncbi:MAG: hypothetical protein HYZ92_02485 [Candidatus Omnitrophica bacterium]|nr:hypothetical protein [Candidatus Omnitrophota bacterium]